MNILKYPRNNVLVRYLCTTVSPKFRPTNLQKWALVWTKKYKTKADIPELVSMDIVERAQSEARIKISNRLIILTVLASLGAIFSGKAAAKRGESIQKMNLDWHKEYVEEYKKNSEANKEK